ncbi:type II secretion system protein GspM [Escherichia coli]
MLLAAVVFLFSVGYYVLIWQPLSERIEQQETMSTAATGDEHQTEERRAGDYCGAKIRHNNACAGISRVISDSASAHW